MGRSSSAGTQPPARDADTKLAQHRLSVLELAKELGNVAEACRQRGLDRTSFCVPSWDAFLKDIDRRLAACIGFSVATLNLDHVVKLRSDGAFLRAYARMTHVTADGRKIAWLSRISHHRVDLVTGSDLIFPVVASAARNGVSAALFGNTQKTLERAAARLVGRHPELRIATNIAPSMSFDPCGAEADAAIQALTASGAGICFIALGAPKQESTRNGCSTLARRLAMIRLMRWSMGRWDAAGRSSAPCASRQGRYRTRQFRMRNRRGRRDYPTIRTASRPVRTRRY